MQFRAVPVSGAEAHGMLTAYFTERAAGFPAEQGKYRPTFPADAAFTPPDGVFLIVDDAPSTSADGTVTDAGGTRGIGCGGIRRIDADPATGLVRYEIKHLWLTDAARGRGTGRALLVELERRAREFGAQELVLDTNASLAAAGGLYRSSGFVEIPPYNDNPNATTWYAKRLAD
ncbi:GNAT family N-acetyltransferase [Agromyces aureus]|uniref:PadR family transcriptional regulator n=1 Tax=Agromyces aureus TaxID=453304 RepID=A0A191WGM5_9MICO|nr:GNAT family N-acetyltransferase [Agromyces aureus]ANJ27450.1 PadR family transcriptional regulator [Agromyces aureus]